MFKRFLSYYKPHKLLFTLDMLASFFMSLIGVVYPIATREMLNNLIPNRRYTDIIYCGLLLLGLYLVRMGLNFFVQYQGHAMGARMQAQMRSDMFNHLEKLPFSFFDTHETGKIMSRMINDLKDISELAHHGPENLIISSISIILSFIYLMTINVWLTLIVFCCVPLLVAVSFPLRRRMRAAFKASRQSIAQINASLEGSISGIRVTKAFDNADKESEKFEEGNALFVDARKKAYKAMGIFFSSTNFITNVFNIVVLVSGGLFMYNGIINFGDFSAFVVAVNLFINPVTTLINFIEQFEEGVAGFERFVEIMDTEPESDLPGARDVERLDGHITLENVTYCYVENHDILHDVSMDIPKGSTFAMVGPSGGGKTTICHLIPNFYELDRGCIKIDGIDIRDITKSSLRRNIGIVQQDIYLFNSTIRDNILYGRLDATKEEVIEAAKRANIHDFIMTLPDGYDTNIGERGVKLSGGQKQRLCIARVFLKNPPILILDEATSALDNTTEIYIQAALDELCKGRTTLVVAHRLSTIKNASEIAVIENGRITEQGDHDELMKAGGTYATLYSQQFRE